MSRWLLSQIRGARDTVANAGEEFTVDGVAGTFTGRFDRSTIGVGPTEYGAREDASAQLTVLADIAWVPIAGQKLTTVDRGETWAVESVMYEGSHLTINLSGIHQ